MNKEVFNIMLTQMKTTDLAIKNIKNYFKTLTIKQMKDNYNYYDSSFITLVFKKETGEYVTTESNLTTRLDITDHFKVVINSSKKRNIYNQINDTLRKERNFYITRYNEM